MINSNNIKKPVSLGKELSIRIKLVEDNKIKLLKANNSDVSGKNIFI